jgi:hypothetical protein
MIGLFMLAASAAASPTDAADAANLAFTQCLFATSREASAARISPSLLEQRLARSCIAEQRELERSTGPRAGALADTARQQVVDAYRKALDLEPQMKRIAEMCRAHPEQCRD